METKELVHNLLQCHKILPSQSSPFSLALTPQQSDSRPISPSASAILKHIVHLQKLYPAS